jgi:cell division protein FtsB
VTLQDDLRKCQGNTVKLRATVETLTQQRDAAIAESAGKDPEIEQLQTQLAAVQAELAGCQEQVTVLEARVKELETPPAPAPQVKIPPAGFWPESPDKTTFPAQRSDLGLDEVVMAYRERGGRGGLDDPLIKSATLWPKTRIAVEVDPRWSGQEQAQYPGAAFMATQTEKIAALAKQAAARKDEIAFVEVDSEADLDKHAPANETLSQRQVGFQKFCLAVAKQFQIYAPELPLVPSFMRGLWTGTQSGRPEDWLTPEVLAVIDGIGVDGYNSPYSTDKVNTPDFLFGKAIAWHTAHGKPSLITEWGSEEYRGDDGGQKAAMYDTMLAFFKAHASTDGKTGLVHIMLNTATDGPAPDNMNWIYHTTPKARQGFIRLTQGLT